jgi:predicted amidohydrolase
MAATTDPSVRRLLVAAAQLSSQSDVAENLATAARVVTDAKARGAELVLLPENFAFMGDEQVRASNAEVLGDRAAPIQTALSRMAREARVHLVAGGMPERSDDARRPYNAALCFAPTGELIASYRKIHLFDVSLADGTAYRESDGNLPGTGPVVVDAAGFRLGLSICYDLRFPELYRELVSLGAEVLLLPAAFTLHTGKDHWHVLTRARAIESQSYVVAAAQWGKHPLGRTTYGHALVADPWGTVLAEAPDGIGFALASIDSTRIQEIRTSLPALTHRRLRTSALPT